MRQWVSGGEGGKFASACKVRGCVLMAKGCRANSLEKVSMYLLCQLTAALRAGKAAAYKCMHTCRQYAHWHA